MTPNSISREAVMQSLVKEPPPSRRLFLRFAGAAPVATLPVILGAMPSYPPPRLHDDGPLLADDVTGTDAFARWNATRRES